MKRACSAIPLLLAACSLVRAQGAPAPLACAEPLSGAKKAELIDYFRKKFDLPPQISFDLIADEALSGGCYRQLTFQGTSAVKTWKLKYYLSPDQRFLTTELLDTALDPMEERRQKDEALFADLSHQSGASEGPTHAPVTLVEFSDFQCPFCRNFSAVLREIRSTERGQIRVVFHHMPLSMHSWARTAAEGAACAQFQNGESFWSIHDKLFEAQKEITLSNVRQKLLDFAGETKTLDGAAFQACLDNQLSLGLVLQDMDLASRAQVSGTPTLFLNGRRFTGIKDAAQLRQAIADAAPVKTAAQTVTAGH